MFVHVVHHSSWKARKSESAKNWNWQVRPLTKLCKSESARKIAISASLLKSCVGAVKHYSIVVKHFLAGISMAGSVGQ